MLAFDSLSVLLDPCYHLSLPTHQKKYWDFHWLLDEKSKWRRSARNHATYRVTCCTSDWALGTCVNAAAPLGFICVYCFQGLQNNFSIFEETVDANHSCVLDVWFGFFFLSLLFRKTWRTLLRFATALVAVKMRNVYTEFMVASLSPMRRDAALSNEGHKLVL